MLSENVQFYVDFREIEVNEFSYIRLILETNFEGNSLFVFNTKSKSISTMHVVPFDFENIFTLERGIVTE